MQSPVGTVTCFFTSYNRLLDCASLGSRKCTRRYEKQRSKREEGIPKSGEALAKGIPYLFKSHESCWNTCARFLCGGFRIPSEGEDKFVIFSMERASLPVHGPPARHQRHVPLKIRCMPLVACVCLRLFLVYPVRRSLYRWRKIFPGVDFTRVLLYTRNDVGVYRHSPEKFSRKKRRMRKIQDEVNELWHY